MIGGCRFTNTQHMIMMLQYGSTFRLNLFKIYVRRCYIICSMWIRILATLQISFISSFKKNPFCKNEGIISKTFFPSLSNSLLIWGNPLSARISSFSLNKFNIPDATIICVSVARPPKHYDLKEINPDKVQPTKIFILCPFLY